jgi:hypothetical protein
MDKSQIKIIHGLFLLMVWLAGCAPVEPGLAVTASPTRELPIATATPTQAAIPAREEAALPTQTPTAGIPACSPASLESGSTGAGLLDKPMDYHVLLPPCYQQGEQKYPVLYLLHGLNANQQQWLDLGIDQKAAEMMLAGEIPPFLIVLPFDHSFKQPGEYRFEEVFLEHLIPEIETAYRVQTDTFSARRRRIESRRSLGNLPGLAQPGNLRHCRGAFAGCVSVHRRRIDVVAARHAARIKTDLLRRRGRQGH